MKRAKPWGGGLGKQGRGNAGFGKPENSYRTTNICSCFVHFNFTVPLGYKEWGSGWVGGGGWGVYGRGGGGGGDYHNYSMVAGHNMLSGNFV